MTRISIRRALPEDAPRLTAIARAAKAGWGYPEAWLAAWDAGLRIAPDYVGRLPVFAAVEGPGIIGFYALERRGAGWLLEHLWIDPARQGRGIGRALFEHALAQARSAGPGTLRIEADPGAAGFYVRMGARRTGAVAAPMDGAPDRVLPLFEMD